MEEALAGKMRTSPHLSDPSPTVTERLRRHVGGKRTEGICPHPSECVGSTRGTERFGFDETVGPKQICVRRYVRRRLSFFQRPHELRPFDLLKIIEAAVQLRGGARLGVTEHSDRRQQADDRYRDHQFHQRESKGTPEYQSTFCEQCWVTAFDGGLDQNNNLRSVGPHELFARSQPVVPVCPLRRGRCTCS